MDDQNAATYTQITPQAALMAFTFGNSPVYVAYKAGAYYPINAGLDLPVSYFRKTDREFYVKEAEE